MSKLCIVCLCLPLAAFAAEEPKSSSRFAAEFGKHWMAAKDLAVAVAQAMPAEGYDFKPVPEEMSFGALMVHIAQGNYGYCSTAAKAKSPFTKPEKSDKVIAVKVLGESFDYCAEIANALTDDQLNESRARGNNSLTVRELLLGVQAHMSHHRGQAEVYLRVKGIKPPDYKF
jgi:uncharacterized damage-inducible protein DinB